MRSRTLAVVPLRSPGVGKTRLAGALDPEQRAVLSAAMLGDVAAALADAAVDEIVVAAGGAAAAAAAAAFGLSVVLDAPMPGGLNAALAEVAGRWPGAQVLIVAADLPRLTAADVDAVLAIDREVVIAPTHAGGTGGLLRRRVGRMGTAFGPESTRRHRDLARAVGASVATLEREGFHHDVDTWTDLVALHEVEVGANTAAVLPGMLGRGLRAG